MENKIGEVRDSIIIADQYRDILKTDKRHIPWLVNVEQDIIKELNLDPVFEATKVKEVMSRLISEKTIEYNLKKKVWENNYFESD